MNVLFLHSGLSITGSYTYARALEKAWKDVHRVYWANDGLDPAEPRGLVVPLRKPLLPYSLLSAKRVASFIREKNIHILHAHSRRASLVAALAARATGVPYVVTAHLRLKPRAANRLLPCWGRRTVAICESIAEHLERENGVPKERIHLIRNGIDLDDFQPPGGAPPKGAIRWITVLGRLSGKRWNAAVSVLALVKDVAAVYPDARFRFVGEVAPDHRDELEEWRRRINGGERAARMETLGHVPDPRPYLAQSALVIAAGRSLMEALSMGRPVVAVGEQATVGLMTSERYGEAQKTNFGDFPYPGTEGFDARPVQEGIDAVFGGRLDLAGLARWGRERIAADYGVEKIARQIDAVYESLAGRAGVHAGLGKRD